MAYATEQTRRQQVMLVGAVALLHGAAIVAIVTGFAGGVVREVVKSLTATNYRDEPAPPPSPTIEPQRPFPKTEDTTTRVPHPEISLTPRNDGVTVVNLFPVRPEPMGDIGDILSRPTPEPKPSPRPTFTPRAAKPKGAPGLWITENDYPTRAIREARAGATRLQLAIGPDGHPSACTVVTSSGSGDLDDTACARMMQRARFEPATGDDGRRTAGSWTTTVRWELPR